MAVKLFEPRTAGPSHQGLAGAADDGGYPMQDIGWKYDRSAACARCDFELAATIELQVATLVIVRVAELDRKREFTWNRMGRKIQVPAIMTTFGAMIDSVLKIV